MSVLTPGSFVWYTRKNALVKVLGFDRESNSYTIEYKGRVIDTIDKFLDKNIGLYYSKIVEEKANLEKRVLVLEMSLVEMRNNYNAIKGQLDVYFKAMDREFSANLSNK